MRITSPLRFEAARAVYEGDLVYVRLGGLTHVGIAGGGESPHLMLLGALGDDDCVKMSRHSFHLVPVEDAGTNCLSLGAEWVIQPIVGELSFSRMNDFWDRPGVLGVRGSKFFLVSSTIDGMGFPSSAWIDLEGLKVIEPEYGKSLPILRWKIWQSETEFKNHPEKPLMHFDARDRAQPQRDR